MFSGNKYRTSDADVRSNRRPRHLDSRETSRRALVRDPSTFVLGDWEGSGGLP